ncbi:hypothetical protein GTO91_15135 [Heliobacterium undosum]|uniref:Uncharacterized protein n=1 Tax=Heliomicrobium undosum TaxID=121734 RepID=A0A845LBJ2_9FIRM|nr:PD40 domain-containing protein [Heliomicrobium undosum]MZP31048.1 hypothetical protein [Heliomicrobium undosum]
MLTWDSGLDDFSVGDDGWIAFSKLSNEYGPYNLYFGNLKNRGIWLFQGGRGSPVRVTRNADKVLGFSPDGKTVLFSRDVPMPITYARIPAKVILLKQQ